MNDFIIISCAFGKRYLQQLDRLEASVRAIYPEFPMMSFRGEQIPGRPFHESLYGFKPHAVQRGLDAGYKKIIFLDPACILQHPVDYWFGYDLPPVIAVKDDNKLEGRISEKAIDYFGHASIIDWHLVGGSLYVFNFNWPITLGIFREWFDAEEDGIFGSQAELSSEQINGHRMDESCMAVAIYSNGIEPVGHDIARYNQNSDSIIIKKHFK